MCDGVCETKKKTVMTISRSSVIAIKLSWEKIYKIATHVGRDFIIALFLEGRAQLLPTCCKICSALPVSIH